MARSGWLLILLMLVGGGSAFAHQTSDAYLALSMTNGEVKGRWAMALRDLNHVLEIDADRDGEVSESELAAGKAKIETYSLGRLKVTVDGEAAALKGTGFETEEHSDAVYATVLFDVGARRGGADFLIEYTLFSETDPLHRGLFRFDLPERTETAVFSPSQPTQRFVIGEPRRVAGFLNFVREGVWHIWIGLDHILFLVALLLPSVLQRVGGRWEPAKSAREALLNIVKVVTAFTVAHSITLSLATLGWVSLPGRLVESVIAASVVAAALNNVRTFFSERAWMVAFGFGLVHGFGFASVLRELELPARSLGAALLGFNLGVEAGQLAIVFLFVPVAFAFRGTVAYRRFVVKYGSVAIAAVATVWFLERALGVERSVLPF